MTIHWENSWTFKTAQFSVTLDYTGDDDSDLSWADEETLDLIHRGVWEVFLFRVRVTHEGREVGCDYLGGSVYANPDDFATEHRKGGAYFPDMIRNAIVEARAELAKPAPYIRRVAA